MRDLRQYKIDIFGLSNSSHEFDFSFEDEFFEAFENSLVSKGKGSCKVELKKTDSMITIDLEVNGVIELECDRSLELFEYPISAEKELIYKYGDEEKELSEDVFVITKGAQEINIASILYESIMLEVPMKKLHPKFDADDESDELIYTSDNEVDEEKESKVDPRWEALKKLK